jgi:ribosomal-protein-serine acetyltransferase
VARWLTWAEKLPTKEEIARFLAHCEEKRRLGDEMHFAIMREDNLVGVIGCAPIDKRNGCVTIGYWLEKAHWGEGIVCRSVRQLANVIFHSGDFERLEIRSAVQNLRGNRVPMLADFRHEGVLRSAQRIGLEFHDLNVYGLVRSDIMA